MDNPIPVASTSPTEPYISDGLADGLGVRGSPASENGGGLSPISAGDDLISGTVFCIDPQTGGSWSSCDEDDDEDRNARLSLLLLWLMPESGLVFRLCVDGGAPPSSIERRVLVSSVDANATSRSKPELTRSCQWDSSSPTSSVVCVHAWNRGFLVWFICDLCVCVLVLIVYVLGNFEGVVNKICICYVKLRWVVINMWGMLQQ